MAGDGRWRSRGRNARPADRVDRAARRASLANRRVYGLQRHDRRSTSLLVIELESLGRPRRRCARTDHGGMGASLWGENAGAIDARSAGHLTWCACDAAGLNGKKFSPVLRASSSGHHPRMPQGSLLPRGLSEGWRLAHGARLSHGDEAPRQILASHRSSPGTATGDSTVSKGEAPWPASYPSCDDDAPWTFRSRLAAHAVRNRGVAHAHRDAWLARGGDHSGGSARCDAAREEAASRRLSDPDLRHRTGPRGRAPAGAFTECIGEAVVAA